MEIRWIFEVDDGKFSRGLGSTEYEGGSVGNALCEDDAVEYLRVSFRDCDIEVGRFQIGVEQFVVEEHEEVLLISNDEVDGDFVWKFLVHFPWQD